MAPVVRMISLVNRIITLAALTTIVYFVSQVQNGLSKNKPPFGWTKDTVFDIIRTSDESTFSCLEHVGRADRQIWDKRVDDEPVVNAFLFAAHYADGTNIEIGINPEFGAQEKAEALRFANPLGQLPSLLRAGIHRFSVHMGQEGFHAGTEQVIVYSGTADERASYNHLEESLFHGSVHASLDEDHRLSDGWKEAQASDGQFLASYAARSPEREDLAETALFAFAILHHPDRFPPADTEATMRAVPHRIEYIRNLFPPGTPLVYSVADAQACR
ncbi:hypothetical protein LHFGNBLO_002527 [Mesorhizobium sp. AR10]|uniref:hypothetical protein n=1 Tax=Mesorhizobium sp. AR10 TaxID=2865839 RepID=UPI0021604A3F|nr:hypothetical protein [Mesorhizobium sp. AR10]UVK40987.1 hypothetical protein LHFGNBLO_002527 [Mesorhizobium sp. AR10]